MTISYSRLTVLPPLDTLCLPDVADIAESISLPALPLQLLGFLLAALAIEIGIGGLRELLTTSSTAMGWG